MYRQVCVNMILLVLYSIILLYNAVKTALFRVLFLFLLIEDNVSFWIEI